MESEEMVQQMLEAQAKCHVEAAGNAVVCAMANNVTQAVLMVLCQPISTTEEISQFGATCLGIITDCLATIYDADDISQAKYTKCATDTCRLMDANIVVQSSSTDSQTKQLANMITEAVLMMLIQLESQESIEFCSQSLQLVQFFMLANIPPPIYKPNTYCRCSEESNTFDDASLRMGFGGSPSSDFVAATASRKRESVGITVNESISSKPSLMNDDDNDRDYLYDDEYEFPASRTSSSTSSPSTAPPRRGLVTTPSGRSLIPPSRGTKRDSVQPQVSVSSTTSSRGDGASPRMPSISEQYDVDITKRSGSRRRISSGISPTAGLEAMERLNSTRNLMSGRVDSATPSDDISRNGPKSLFPPPRRDISISSRGVEPSPVPPTPTSTPASISESKSLAPPTRRKFGSTGLAGPGAAGTSSIVPCRAAATRSSLIHEPIQEEDEEAGDYGWAVESNHPMYSSVASAMGVKLANCEWGSDPPIYTSVAKSMKITLPSVSTWEVEASSVYPSVQIIMGITFDGGAYKDVDSSQEPSSAEFGWASVNNHALYQSVANAMGMELCSNCNWGGAEKSLYSNVAKSMDIHLAGRQFELETAAVYPSTAILMGWMGPSEYTYPREPMLKSESSMMSAGEKPLYDDVGRLMNIWFESDGLEEVVSSSVVKKGVAAARTSSLESDKDAWAFATSHSMYQSVANAMGMQLPNCDWGGANPAMYPGVAAMMRVTLPNSHWKVEESSVYPSVAILLGIKFGGSVEDEEVYASSWPADKPVDYGWASSNNHSMYQSVANAMNMTLPGCDWGASNPPIYSAVADLMNITMPNSHLKVEESALYPSVEILMRLEPPTGDGSVVVSGKGMEATATKQQSWTPDEPVDYGWAVAGNHPMYTSVASIMGFKLSNCDWGSDPPIYATVAEAMMITLPSSKWRVEESSVYPSVQIMMNISYDKSTKKDQPSSNLFGWASANNHAVYQSVAHAMGMELQNCNWGGTDKPVYPDVAKAVGIYLPGSEFEVENAAVYPSTAVLMGWMNPTDCTYPREPVPKSSWVFGEKSVYASVGRLMGIRFPSDSDDFARDNEAVAARGVVSKAKTVRAVEDASKEAWAYASSHPVYPSVANAMGMCLANSDWGSADPALYPAVAELMKVTLSYSKWRVEEAAVYPSVAILLGLKFGVSEEEDEDDVVVSSWPTDKAMDYGWASANNHPVYQSVASAMGMKLSNCDWCSNPPVYSAVADLMKITLPNDKCQVEKSALYPSVQILMRLTPGGGDGPATEGPSESLETTLWVPQEPQIEYGWAVASNHPMYTSVAAMMGVQLANCNWGANNSVYKSVAKAMLIDLPSNQWKVEESSVYPSVQILMNITYVEGEMKEESPSTSFGWASANNHAVYQSVAYSMGMRLVNTDWCASSKPLYPSVGKSMGIYVAGAEFEVDNAAVYPSTAILMGWMHLSDCTYPRERMSKSMSSLMSGDEKPIYAAVGRLMGIRFKSDGEEDISSEGVVSTAGVAKGAAATASANTKSDEDAWAYASSHSTYQSVANAMGMRLCDWGAADPPMYPGVAELMKVTLPNSHWNVEQSAVYPSVAILLGLKFGAAEEETKVFVSKWPADTTRDYGWASTNNHPMYQSVANAMKMSLSGCDWGASNPPIYAGVADMMNIKMPNGHFKAEQSALYPSVKILMRLEPKNGDDSVAAKEIVAGEPSGKEVWVPEAPIDYGWAVQSNHPMYGSVAAMMGVTLANCDWGANPPIYHSVAKAMNIALPSSHWRVEDSPVYPSVKIMMNITYDKAASREEESKSPAYFGWTSANNHALYQSVAHAMGMELHNCNWGGIDKPLYTDVAKSMGVYLPGSEFEVEEAALYPSTAVLMGMMGPSEYTYPREPMPKHMSSVLHDEKPVYAEVARLMGIRFESDGDDFEVKEAVVSSGGGFKGAFASANDTRHSDNAWAYASNHPVYASVANAMGMRLSNCDWGANASMYPGVADLMKVTLPSQHWNVEESPVYPSVGIWLGMKFGGAVEEEPETHVSSWPADKAVDFGWASANNHGMYQSVASLMGMQLSNCEWSAVNALYDGVAAMLNITLPRSAVDELALYPSVGIIMMMDRGTIPADSGASSAGWAAGSNHPMYQSVANAMGLKLSHCDWGSDLPVYEGVGKNMRIRFKNSHWKVEEAALYPSTAILMEYMALGASSYPRISPKESSEHDPFFSNIAVERQTTGTAQASPQEKENEKKIRTEKTSEKKRSSWQSVPFGLTNKA